MSINGAMFLTDNNMYFLAHTVQELFCRPLISLKYVKLIKCKSRSGVIYRTWKEYTSNSLQFNTPLLW